jgi:hypothetical protein
VITAPAEAPVGAQVAVNVGGDLPDGTPVTLVAIGTYGPRADRATAIGGVAGFVLPPEWTRKAGVVTLTATAGGARGEAQVTLRAGGGIEPIVPLVGPRSIVADGREWTMIALVPQDGFGNPLADGTPVQLRARHPQGPDEQRDLTVQHLLAWARIDSRTRAGRGTISVAVGGVPGPEAAFQEVPGWPVALDLSADPPTLPADGRQFVTLRTGVLRDRFDNVVADGTLVTFIVDGPDGAHRAIPANTVGGVAEAQLRAPASPATLTARATIYGVESAPVQIAFTPGPAAGAFGVAAQSDDGRGVLTITTGPLLDAFGGYVPDGTAVAVLLTDDQGRATQFRTTAAGGHARLEVRLAGLAPGRYEIEVVAGSGRGTTEVAVP